MERLAGDIHFILRGISDEEKNSCVTMTTTFFFVAVTGEEKARVFLSLASFFRQV
jgi:hypothetical protein